MRLGYQKTRMMKSKCPLCPIVWINVLWSMEQRLECFNVAEVDILTDLLILDSLSELPHNKVGVLMFYH